MNQARFNQNFEVCTENLTLSIKIAELIPARTWASLSQNLRGRRTREDARAGGRSSQPGVPARLQEAFAAAQAAAQLAKGTFFLEFYTTRLPRRHVRAEAAILQASRDRLE